MSDEKLEPPYQAGRLFIGSAFFPVPEERQESAIRAVDPYGGQHTLEDGRAAALLLALDFATHRLRFRHRIQCGELYVQRRVAVAVVAPHGGLRSVCEGVIELPLRVGDEPPDVEKAV